MQRTYNATVSLSAGLTSRIGAAIKIALAVSVATFGWQIVSAIATLAA